MDENDFRKRADETLQALYRSLSDAADDYGFEVDLQAGALTVEFEHPRGKFVISPNAPVRQLWVSARSKSYKLDWDSVENTFVYGSDRQPIKSLLEEALSKQLGTDVSL
jgi:CyaY protein